MESEQQQKHTDLKNRLFEGKLYLVLGILLIAFSAYTKISHGVTCKLCYVTIPLFLLLGIYWIITAKKGLSKANKN